jgi:hypothetical protein
MKCTQARSLFSPCLDGVVTGAQMLAVERHLDACAPCRLEYRQLTRTQALVHALGPRRAPETLALQLRVALSRRSADTLSRRIAAGMVRLENAINGFLLPATAGLVSTVLLFGLLVGIYPVPAQAGANDVPTLLYLPPQLEESPFAAGLSSLNSADALVVETYVDANGRVQTYRILAGPEQDETLRAQLNNALIFTTFRPAMSFGRPTAGRVVLSFSKVSVKG